MSAPIVGDWSRTPWPVEHLAEVAESARAALRVSPLWADGQLWERIAEGQS